MSILFCKAKYRKQLDRAIKGGGIELDGSKRCARRDGRYRSHGNRGVLVRERIALLLRTRQLLDDTDAFIDRTHHMLDRFEEDDKRWKMP